MAAHDTAAEMATSVALVLRELIDRAKTSVNDSQRGMEKRGREVDTHGTRRVEVDGQGG